MDDSRRRAEFDENDERLARVAWSRLAEPGDAVAQQLVAAEGAVAALAQVLAGRGPERLGVRCPTSIRFATWLGCTGSVGGW